MKIATWNVNGVRARYREMVEWVEQERPDIFCLQEIKASAEQVPDSLTGLPDYWNYWHGAPRGYSGVSLHVRRELTSTAPPFNHPSFDMEARIVQVTLNQLVVASVYVPNGNRNYEAKLTFVQSLVAHVEHLIKEGYQVLVCGDLNIARAERDVHPKQRDARKIGQQPEERELFESLLGRGLTDIGRALEPDNDALFTWWAPWRDYRKRNVGWRLDYVLASAGIAPSVQSCRVLRESGTSDHGAVIAEFAYNL